jgi:hypothetical protein
MHLKECVFLRMTTRVACPPRYALGVGNSASGGVVLGPNCALRRARALPVGNTRGWLARALHVFREPVAVLPRWRFNNPRSTTMNGLIKTAALAAMLASMSAFAQQDPAAAAAGGGDFATLDANGDGSVSQDEAKADATLSSKFAELDTNKDGKLSSSEYGKKMDSGKEEKKY